MNNILLHWYSIKHNKKKSKYSIKYFLKLFFQKEKENYGDLLSKYLVEKISGKKTSWYNPNQMHLKKHFFVIGSILNYSNEKTVVWGSGIINRNHKVLAQDFRAVRGPLTRERLIELGKLCPEVYGDPAILLPKYYNPKIKKKYTLGIITHYVDYTFVTELYKNQTSIKIINMLTSNIKKTTQEILECSNIISSSLHGMIISHSYRIPSIWVKFTGKLYGDDVKFNDYLLSVNMKPYEGVYINKTYKKSELLNILNSKDNLPNEAFFEKTCQNLILSCPFIKN